MAEVYEQSIALAFQDFLPNLLRHAWRAIKKTVYIFLIFLPGIFIFIPVFMMFIGSFSQTWDSRGMSGFTLHNYMDAIYYAKLPIWISLKVSVLTVAIDVIIGIPFAYALVRFPFRGKSILEELINLPIIVPGLVIGMAILKSLNFLYGGWLIIVCGHVIWTLPFVIWPVVNVLESFDFVSLEKAALTLGASRLKLMFVVVLPNIALAASSGAAMAFIISFSEFNGTFLLASGANMPVSASLYSAAT
ncbi:MAG: ABC transporter permease subunit, partial [Spirochaetota bacterium]